MAYRVQRFSDLDKLEDRAFHIDEHVVLSWNPPLEDETAVLMHSPDTGQSELYGVIDVKLTQWLDLHEVDWSVEVNSPVPPEQGVDGIWYFHKGTTKVGISIVILNGEHAMLFKTTWI